MNTETTEQDPPNPPKKSQQGLALQKVKQTNISTKKNESLP
jgi:hypothetical protein